MPKKKKVPAIFIPSLIVIAESSYGDRLRLDMPKSLQILKKKTKKRDSCEFPVKTGEIHNGNDFWRTPDPGKRDISHFRLKDRTKNTTTTSVIVESDSPKMQNNRKTIAERMNASLL